MLANEASDGKTLSVSAGVHYYDNYAFLRNGSLRLIGSGLKKIDLNKFLVFPSVYD